MAIVVRCDACGQGYRVREERAGTWISCRKCGHRIDVPFPDSDLEWTQQTSLRSVTPRASRSRRQRKTRRSGPHPGIIIGAIAGGVLLVVVVVLVAVRSRRPGPGLPAPAETKLAQEDSRPEGPAGRPERRLGGVASEVIGEIVVVVA